uniref:Uncharacterized protein n=1 Tax=Tanacetum cinerariifolium TaxID=118510 RepID=A0A699GMQ1_TANCI|nr:hypothetical protein [Tanacetum cinerariifolium]
MSSITAQQAKLDLELVPKEKRLEIRKCNSKRVKRPAKKSTKAPARGVVIRETSEMPLSKKKEKVDVTQESNHEENEEDEDDEQEVKDEFVKTRSKNSDDEDETKITDKAEGDKDEEMDYTTVQLYDYMDIRLNEPVDTDKGFVQEEGTNTAMTNKTEVPVASSSHASDLVAKFLNFSDIPHTNAEIMSLMDAHVHHERKCLTLPPPVIQKMVKESLKDAVLAKKSFQPQSSYEATATLTEFELNEILIDKMDKSESYLEAPEHRECYEGLKKSYNLDKSIFSTYGKVYSLKRSRKDKDEDPSTGSDRRLKKSSNRKSVQSEEPEFKVTDSDIPQDQEENLSNNDEEPKEKVASKRNWFTKPTQPQEPTDPDWNVGKTLQQGQNHSWLMTLASSSKKPSKTFDELMSTPIDFSTFIMNGLKINNLTQETLLGQAFRLLKGTRSNYAELEYDFKECYKALSEKLDLENSKGDDYPFDLTKPLPFVCGNHQKVHVNYFFNNDLKYLQGRVLTMTYTTFITKTKAAQYDLPGNLTLERTTTLTRLRTSLDDITKNIRMEYLPKRRWRTLEKKRANIMIKAIDKKMKERRMMRSLKKFVGGKDYKIDLWLLQRTI